MADSNHKKQRFDDNDYDDSSNSSYSNREGFSSASESNNTVYESEAFKKFEYVSESDEDDDFDEEEDQQQQQEQNSASGSGSDINSRRYTYAMVNGKIRRTPNKSKTFSINGNVARNGINRSTFFYDDSDYDDRNYDKIFDVSKQGKEEKEHRKRRFVSWKTQFVGSLKKNVRFLTRNTTRLIFNIVFPLIILCLMWGITCIILSIKKPVSSYNNPLMDYPEVPLPTFSTTEATDLCNKDHSSCGLAVYPRDASTWSVGILLKDELKDPVTGRKPSLHFFDDEDALVKEMSDSPGRHFGGVAFHCWRNASVGACRNYTLHMSANLLPIQPVSDTPVNIFSGIMAQSHNSSLYISSGFMTLQNAVDSALTRFETLRSFNLTVRTKALPVDKMIYISLPFGLVFAAAGGISLIPLLCSYAELVLFERVRRVRYYLFMLGMRKSAYWLALTVTEVALGLIIGIVWIVVSCAAVWTDDGITAVLTLALAWIGYMATLLLFVFVVHKIVDTRFWNFFIIITFAAVFPALGSLIPSVREVQGVLSGFLSPYTFYLIVASVVGRSLHGPTPSSFTTAELFAFLLGNFVFYGFVCWFINESCSGDYGVSRGPFFFLHKSYWRPVHQATLMEKAQLSKNALPPRNFEPPLADDFGVRIYGLTKVYDGNTGRKKIGSAVSGLSAPFCRGQVTCILGQSGSGKSTLLSMLCGLVKPTSGEAMVDGRSITSDLDAIQKVIGYCPGSDILYPDLTPEDHIDFISCVRGKKSRLSGSRHTNATPTNVKTRNRKAGDITFVSSVLSDVGLIDNRKSKASSLTPGMRRRLSLAIALIGDPKIVLLDEPSGNEGKVDTASKRIIWTALKRIRGANRTIVFTSRSLEEAEHLGDYVYFMDDGKFKCGGSPDFLEKRFGVGYYLNVISRTGYKVKSVVKECVPGASFVASTSKSILFKLPFSQTQLYSTLFRRLEKDGASLGVTKFKLHLNTLGDVFSKICTKVESRDESGESKGRDDGKAEIDEEEDDDEEEEDNLYSKNVSPSVEDYSQGIDNSVSNESSHLLSSSSNLIGSAGLDTHYGSSISVSGRYEKIQLDTGKKRASFFRQLFAMLKYKFLFFVRKPTIFIPMILVPLVYFIVSMLVVMGCFRVVDINNERAKLTYHNISIYEPSYIPFVINSGPEVVFDDIDKFTRIMESPVLRMSPVENVSMLNRIAYSRENNVNVALIFNAFNIDKNTADITIMYNQTDLTSPVSILDFLHSGIYSLFRDKHYDPSGVWAHPVVFSGKYSETASSGKIYAKLIYGVVGIFMIVLACIRVSTKFVKNAVEERTSGFKAQLYAAGLFPVVYVTTTIFASLVPLVFVYVITEVVFAFFELTEFAGLETFFIVFLGMLLFFISLSSFNLTFSNLFKSPPTASRALYGILVVITIIPALLSILALVVPSSVEAAFRFIFGLVSPPFAFADLLWAILIQGDTLSAGSRLLWKNHTSESLLILGMDSLVYILLCLAIEYRMDNNSIARENVGKSYGESEEGDDEKVETLFIDKDVEIEKNRVLDTNKSIDDPAIVRKLQMKDVHTVTFGVQKGECFGLLGPDNSGKSSVLAAIAGQIPCAHGEVISNGVPLRTQQRLSLYFNRGSIAYCPQCSEFADYLTGREHLELFTTLRTANAGHNEVKDIVQHALRHIRLTEEADKRVGSYGTDAAKKLCVATALLPGTSLVLFDEPTEGTSTQARRAIWSFIRRESNRLGKTVLLATTSMSEAEELCSTIGVMANGVLQSLGSMKKLKHKFSNNGYVVSVDLEPSSDIPEIERLLSNCCRCSRVGTDTSIHTIENYSFRHTYVLKNLTSLSALFDSLEQIHLRCGVRNYGVSQASLENVFFYVIREHDEVQED